jgi:dTDP-4-dehydrorhamnose 3,5-epimerase
MSATSSDPYLINGGRATDDRGSLEFFNELDISKFKRFYTVENHENGFIRAWHGHLKESKVLIPLRGALLACAVKLTSTELPDKNQEVFRQVLSASNPKALFIPPGYANGFKTLSQDSLVMVLSSTTLEESLGDDYRFPFDYWNPWHVEPR